MNCDRVSSSFSKCQRRRNAHHSTNHDHIRSQYFTDRKNIKHPDDPQHDVEAVERMTNSKGCWIQAKTGSNEEQYYSTSITQIPFGRGPFLQFLV